MVVEYHFNSVARFDRLCRSGTLEEVRTAVAKGVNLAPLLKPYDAYVTPWNGQPLRRDPEKEPVLMDGDFVLPMQDQFTGRSGHDGKFLAYLLNRYILYRPKTAPLVTAVEHNPDPGVAVFLIENNARDHTGFLSSVLNYAFRRSVDANGLFSFKPYKSLSFPEEMTGAEQVYPFVEGTIEIVEACFAKSPELREKDTGLYVLLDAIRHSDDPKVISAVLAHTGLNPSDYSLWQDYSFNSENYMYSPIFVAAYFAHNPEIVDVLVKAGADVNACSNEKHPFRRDKGCRGSEQFCHSCGLDSPWSKTGETMRHRVKSVSICFLTLAAAFVAGCSGAKFYPKGLPAEVSLLAERIIDCNHWLGEYPYDDKRAEDIQTALEELRCGDIEKDKKTILDRFKENQRVQQTIQEAESTVW